MPKALDEAGVVLLTADIKTLADATYPANAAIASNYDSTASYAVGDYCLRTGLLYKCNTAISSGGEAWTAAHWTQINVSDEIKQSSNTKQDVLVSGTNIKTINGTSILGSGNIATAPIVGQITVPYASWSGSGPYTQTVTISGATITANTKVDIQPDATTVQQMITDGVAAMYIENNAGTLTVYSIGAATTADITVQVTYYETE